jgi:hypothetical protein
MNLGGPLYGVTMDRLATAPSLAWRHEATPRWAPVPAAPRRVGAREPRPRSSHRVSGQRRREQLAPVGGERVHDHLAIAPARHNPMGAQQPQVMGHKVLGPLHDPGQVADANLVRLHKGGGQCQAGRVGERFGLSGNTLRSLDAEPARARSALSKSRQRTSQRITHRARPDAR